MNNIMTDAELAAIGMTRTEWNKSIAEEGEYIENWALTVNSTDL